jgi:hypothetical protein
VEAIGLALDLRLDAVHEGLEDQVFVEPVVVKPEGVGFLRRLGQPVDRGPAAAFRIAGQMVVPEAALARLSKVFPQVFDAHNLAGFLFNGVGSFVPDHLENITDSANDVVGVVGRNSLGRPKPLGYVSLSRGGVELLFRVFGDRYERASMLITSNLPFSDWGQIFQVERMSAAMLDRLTHHCHIFEMNGENYCFRESMKAKKGRKTAQHQIAVLAQSGHLEDQGGSELGAQDVSKLGAQFHPLHPHMAGGLV